MIGEAARNEAHSIMLVRTRPPSRVATLALSHSRVYTHEKQHFPFRTAVRRLAGATAFGILSRGSTFVLAAQAGNGLKREQNPHGQSGRRVNHVGTLAHGTAAR